jgi:hypothetical protein
MDSGTAGSGSGSSGSGSSGSGGSGSGGTAGSASGGGTGSTGGSSGASGANDGGATEGGGSSGPDGSAGVDAGSRATPQEMILYDDSNGRLMYVNNANPAANWISNSGMGGTSSWWVAGESCLESSMAGTSTA